MKRLLSFFLILGLAACSSGHHEPFDDSTPEVRDIKALYSNFRETAALSTALTIREIGRVVYGSFSTPILCISYRNPDISGKKPSILIDGGVHGNEPAGVLYVSELVSRLAEGSTPLNQFDLDIIPLVNPWGWSHDIRFNKDGIDINRDFSSPESREGKIIMEFFRDKHYDLVMDLHEDPNAEGVYFYQYARENRELLTQLINRIKAMQYPIENNVNMIILKTENGIIDAPMWGLWYVKLTRQLSLSNYCRMELSKDVFTLESPTHLPVEKRIQVHRTAARFLSESLLSDQ